MVKNLAEKIRRLEAGVRALDEPRVSAGSAAVDTLLPGGLRRGSLVDWLSSGPGGGAGALALQAARAACADGGALVVVDPAGEFCPTAAAGRGVDLEKLILVRPASQADLIWTLEQTLRCPGVAAVYAMLVPGVAGMGGVGEAGSGNVRSGGADGRVSSFNHGGAFPDRVCRRLQLSAELGGAIGLFLLPAAARRQPAWADVRFWVEPVSQVQVHGRPTAGSVASQAARRLRVERLAGRGPNHVSAIELELDDETGDVRLAAPLAPATQAARGSPGFAAGGRGLIAG